MTELSRLICLHPNKAVNHIDRKTKINGLFSRKSNSAVIKELSNFINSISGQNKNKMALIVVLALLRRNLDCVEELKDLLVRYDLTGPLFGGIKVLLSGKSETFATQIKWSDDTFNNKYEWLSRFSGQFQYWEFIELLQAIKILHMVKRENIEKIIKEDRTRLVLLNMLSWNLDIVPNDNMIKWLLNNSDELNQNIGFYMITRKISYILLDIEAHQRMELSMLDVNFVASQRKEHRRTLILMSNELQQVEQFLSMCSNKIKVSLLMNFILTQRQSYPLIFAHWLIEVDNQEHLVAEIKNSRKFRTLQHIHILLSMVAKTRRKKNYEIIPSKMPLYNAIIDNLSNFIRDRSGIYKWEEQEEIEFSNICVMLPKQSKKRFTKFLLRELETLAISDIDKLLRHRMYLEDERKSQIINGMLSIANG